MAGDRGERADATRNRKAILRATEELLTRLRPEQISMEQIAAAAGVGKGTVFHRFGSRMGLMTALMTERALDLQEAVESGPPPLGPAAEPRTRLLAFLDAVVDVVSRNKGLMAALGHATTTHKPTPGTGQSAHPVYDAWQTHVAALIRAERPDLDAELMAHILLAPLMSDVIIHLLRDGQGHRLSDSLRALALALISGTPHSIGLPSA